MRKFLAIGFLMSCFMLTCMTSKGSPPAILPETTVIKFVAEKPEISTAIFIPSYTVYIEKPEVAVSRNTTNSTVYCANRYVKCVKPEALLHVDPGSMPTMLESRTRLVSYIYYKILDNTIQTDLPIDPGRC